MNLKSTVIAGFLITTGSTCSVASSIIANEVVSATMHENRISQFDNEYEKIYKELESYKKLENNWDGYQGVRPSNELIKTSKEFLTILKNETIVNPSIMVSGKGEIALFWKNKDTYIEVNFDIENKYSYFFKMGTKIYGEDDIEVMVIADKLMETLSYVENSTNSNWTKNFDSQRSGFKI